MTDIKLPKIFADDPELKARIEAYLDKIPNEKKKQDFENFKKFVSGEMTWAEITHIPKPLLKEITDIAYLKFKKGDYPVAESLFKGLSVIDHSNWYYRAALGAIYQKQKLYDQAVEEYTMALSFYEDEVSVLTNRGECYLRLGHIKEALHDLNKAIGLDEQSSTMWGKRARLLVKSTETQTGMRG